MNEQVPDTHSQPRGKNTDSVGNAYGGTGQIVDPSTGEIISRSFESPKQAFECANRLLIRNRGRNEKLAAIMDKFDDSPPWSPQKLKESGQGWRNNCPTGFLSSMIRRGAIPYNQLVNNAKYLTFATLDGDDPTLRDKERKFREEISKTIKAWPDWPTFRQMIVQDGFIGGYVFACYTNEFEWRPRHFRQDDAMVPDGSGQTADKIPLIVLRIPFMPHELTDVTVNKEISEQYGWNWQNVAKAINEAQPVKALVTTGDEVKLQDLQRETSMGRTYTEGVRVIETYWIATQEPNGKVSSYLVRQKDGLELRTVLDQFDSMSQVVTPFCLEAGNGKIHGSKGAGRLLYNDHVSIENNRNQFRDMVYLKSLILLEADGTARARGKIGVTVAAPMAVLPEGYKVVDNPITADVEDHITLDNHLVSIAENKLSIITPQQFDNPTGDKATASEVNYVASIESQTRDGSMARAWIQWMTLTSEIQRRICLPANIKEARKRLNDAKSWTKRLVLPKVLDFMRYIGMNVSGLAPAKNDQSLDEDAVKCCMRLLRYGLTETEIFELATSPAWPVSDEGSQNDAQKLAAVVAAYKGDPDVDQHLLKRMDLTQAVGGEVADQLLPPNFSQTQTVEAVRQQLSELSTIMTMGDAVPVSPRDMHIPHMDTIMQKVGQHFQELAQFPPQTYPMFKSALDHFDAHLQGAQQQGAPPDALVQYREFAKAAHKLVDQGPAQQQPPQLPQGAIPANALPGDEGMSQPQQPTTTQSPVMPNSSLNAVEDKPLSRGPKVLTTPQGPMVQNNNAI